MGFTEEKMSDLKSFTAKSKRVWRVMKKPSRKEYETVAKITAIGIGIIGLVGFLISIIMQIFV